MSRLKIIVLSFFVLFFSSPGNILHSEEIPRRGIFVSMIQNPPTLSDPNLIQELIAFANKAHIQTLFVQVYRANKSFFPSQVADETPYENAMKNMSQDPFALLLEKAHLAGIQVHAWINLLSLSANENAPLLQKYGPEILTKNLEKKENIQDYKIDNQYFLEPGDLRVREELAKLVREIVGRYPNLDGIQFDYIRYPDYKPHYGFAKMNIDRFQHETKIKTIKEESAEWKKWKRDQVTNLLKLLIKTAREINPGIHVSTTGLAPFSRAYHEAYQDWKFWVESGLVEFVTEMAYTENPEKFQDYMKDVKTHIAEPKQINMAVAAYKLMASPAKLQEQWDICEKESFRSCVLFHYGSLIENPELKKALEPR